jgi:hypothetical protein
VSAGNRERPCPPSQRNPRFPTLRATPAGGPGWATWDSTEWDSTPLAPFCRARPEHRPRPEVLPGRRRHGDPLACKDDHGRAPVCRGFRLPALSCRRAGPRISRATLWATALDLRLDFTDPPRRGLPICPRIVIHAAAAAGPGRAADLRAPHARGHCRPGPVKRRQWPARFPSAGLSATCSGGGPRSTPARAFRGGPGSRSRTCAAPTTARSWTCAARTPTSWRSLGLGLAPGPLDGRGRLRGGPGRLFRQEAGRIPVVPQDLRRQARLLRAEARRGQPAARARARLHRQAVRGPLPRDVRSVASCEAFLGRPHPASTRSCACSR